MGRTSWAFVAFTALGMSWIAGSVQPAAADPYDYPWCIQGRDEGYPGYCGYQTYEQCQASASGRDAYCGINPRVAFSQQRIAPRAPR
ncbi:DUF3551 domain-containing protein [Bradyrhizobium sp. CER78]|uniref:DUF3551 domain-containing protein n=1 Tax=Bradyrhizobium sp. CER78 TaxID=3039162 RepID=UPI00244BD2D0|nr:DUF3551 domain-containing protein [Bradyrhizobium sp. CER78]MDH2381213.1 DUF3551 domain-containing protein [Bradyrhizobium sp. CER78]